jgi:thiaminase/transcriptional activator TenA
MDLHRSFVAEFGISADDLEREEPHPTTIAYTSYLLRVAAVGSYAELVAALLPCMWGYSDLGQYLKARGLPADTRYAKWIEMYADPDFADLAQWCRSLLDRIMDEADSAAMRPVTDAFIRSSQYELDFWEMAWAM